MKILRILSVTCLTMFISYILTAFVTWQVNPGLWSTDVRYFVSCVTFLATIISCYNQFAFDMQ